VEGWRELASEKETTSIKGLFIFKGSIYFHDHQKIAPFTVRINKTKVK
jgi:hypothetical protein